MLPAAEPSRPARATASSAGEGEETNGVGRDGEHGVPVPCRTTRGGNGSGSSNGSSVCGGRAGEQGRAAAQGCGRRRASPWLPARSRGTGRGPGWHGAALPLPRLSHRRRRRRRRLGPGPRLGPLRRAAGTPCSAASSPLEAGPAGRCSRRAGREPSRAGGSAGAPRRSASPSAADAREYMCVHVPSVIQVLTAVGRNTVTDGATRQACATPTTRADVGGGHMRTGTGGTGHACVHARGTPHRRGGVGG